MDYHPDIETDGDTRSTLKLVSGRCIITDETEQSWIVENVANTERSAGRGK
jgi:hypothetical protein